MHYHLTVLASEAVVGESHFDGEEESLINFVKLSNGIFGNIDDKDTRISLEECYEALEEDPRALFVGWGILRVVWAKCAGDCTPPLMN